MRQTGAAIRRPDLPPGGRLRPRMLRTGVTGGTAGRRLMAEINGNGPTPVGGPPGARRAPPNSMAATAAVGDDVGRPPADPGGNDVDQPAFDAEALFDDDYLYFYEELLSD